MLWSSCIWQGDFIEIGEYESVSWNLGEEGFVGGEFCWSFGL